MSLDGHELARVLWAFAEKRPGPVVVAPPGDSREIAAAVAHALRAPLDPRDVRGRTVIVVEDGATPYRSLRATLREVRRRGAARIVLATPMADSQTLVKLARHADQVVCTHAISEDEAQTLRIAPARLAAESA